MRTMERNRAAGGVVRREGRGGVGDGVARAGQRGDRADGAQARAQQEAAAVDRHLVDLVRDVIAPR